MKIQLIRHATLLIEIEGKKIIVDPMLSSKGTMEAIPFVTNKNNNPLADLPIEANRLIHVDAILLTHTHRDHFDETAIQMLSKSIPVLCQPNDIETIKSKGFMNVYPVQESYTWENITFHRTEGQHGKGLIGKKMGAVSGFVITTSNKQSLYITGDTIWCKEVENALTTFQPNVTAAFAGAAQFNVGAPITMTAQDIEQICKKANNTKVIAVHMEAWNHCTLSRHVLQEFIQQQSLSHQVYIPQDGEVLSFY